MNASRKRPRVETTCDVTNRSRRNKGCGPSIIPIALGSGGPLGAYPAAEGCFSRGHHYHQAVVNARNDLIAGLAPPRDSTPVEWRESERLVAYEAAVSCMQARAAAISEGSARELVWLLEHPPIYTAGTSAKAPHLIEARFPVHASGRGGQFTYHGPGQRIAYVMLDLALRGQDLRRFVATLEEWIIRTLAVFGVTGERREQRIGVWVRRPEQGRDREDKIAAIGVRLRRWVTLHGIAINVSCDLSHYTGIVPCGVAEPSYGVTSLADLGVPATLAEVDAVLQSQFQLLFGSIEAARAGKAEF
jgi:lipoyl(octanoyl) transferase